MVSVTATTEPQFRIANLGRHSIIYGVGMVLSKAVAFVMLPIYTRWLTPADYGVLQLITMTFEVVTIFAGSRIALGIFHFYHKEESETGRREVLSTAFLLLAGTFALAAVATTFAAPAIARVVFGAGQQYVAFVRLAAASMAFEGLLLVPIALFRLQNRSTTFVFVSLARLCIQVVLNLIFLIPFEMGVFGVLLSSLVTHVVIGLALGVPLLASVGMRFKGRSARAFLRFGAPLMVMQGATFIVTFGDRYFLNRAAGTAEVGLYGLAYQFGFLVSTFGYIPFERVWGPQRFEVAKRPDRDVIFAQVFVYLNVVLISVALGVAVFAGDVLRLIAAPEFHHAAAFIPLLAAAYVFPCWSSHLNLGTYITERPEYYTLAKWVAAVVAIAGYVLLVPRWLAWGAVITTLASLAVDAWLSHMFSQRLWRVEYRWTPIVRLAALAIAVGTISVLLPTMVMPLSIGAHAALYALYLGLLWSLPILTPEERSLILRRLAQGRRRRRTAP